MHTEGAGEMTNVFLHFANVGITASYLILAALVLRLILRKVPKNLLIWLWALVAIRLALPISLESALSLIPKRQPIPANILLAPEPTIDSGIPVIDRAVNPVITENFSPTVTASVNPMQVILPVISIVWLVGVGVILLYAVISYIKLSRQVSVSIHLRENLYLCDGIPTPFILGIVKPKIYLPSDMEAQNQSYVLKHERAHLRHHDNLWKPLGFLLLAVYWFHPLVWIAYLLFCRDLEMACDERAIMDFDDEEKKAYSYALLSCAASKRALAICPVAFGENSVKSRIQNVLHFKKASVWIAVAVFLIIALVAVFFLTNPREEALPDVPGNEAMLPDEPVTVPGTTETASTLEETEFEPPNGIYTYINGNLSLEFQNISKALTRTVRNEQGEEYVQTTLLTRPGVTVAVLSADMDGSKEAWRLCEATGALAPIAITDQTGRWVLANNEYYLENISSGFRGILTLKPGAALPLKNGIINPKTAKAVAVFDQHTGKTPCSYHPYLRVAPGNLGKMALALVVLENHAPEERVDTTTIPQLPQGCFTTSKVHGPSLEDLGEMSVEDLLAHMLLSGFDDAAYALARFDAGSEEAMVEKMNVWARSVSYLDTHYTDLYGLAEGQYTTAADTMALVNRVLAKPCLAKIWALTQYSTPTSDGSAELTSYTTNYLHANDIIPDFYDLRVTGGFGFYKGSADMVCTAKQGDQEIICVLLGAERILNEIGFVDYYGNCEEMSALVNTVLG